MVTEFAVGLIHGADVLLAAILSILIFHPYSNVKSKVLFVLLTR